MKEIMEVELKCSIKDVDYYEALKENWIAFSNVSASQSTTIPSPKKIENLSRNLVKIVMTARN